MILQQLLVKKYNTLNTIEISKSALLRNYHYLSKLSGMKIAPVLKSNAYGHGLIQVAKILDTVDAPFFCVDSLFEAYELFKAKIKTPILIMGYTDPENFKVKKLPFSFAVFDKKTLAVLNNYQAIAKIHIFVDIGLHREGIEIDDIPDFIEYSSSLKKISIEGIMSHFAASDLYDDHNTQAQVLNFQKIIRVFAKAHIRPKYIHFGNSAATLLPRIYKVKIGNLSRVGIATYGIGGEIDNEELVPAMRVISTLIQIKQIKKGDTVGYDFTFKANKNMTIGIIPYGYYDGLDRRLSNKGFVTINGIDCPILGRVSMNITVIDISKVVDPEIGQEVVIYSNKSIDKNSFRNTAILTGTIQRDLLVHLAASTRRIVVT